jgi:deoxyribodipyrimidine photo-lyase|tara:strand:- start:1010 stop:2434 length:1425 start_codon:yes stop_codon:yes gene_type:complete
MDKISTGVVWLRGDFRTIKNDALIYASKNHEHVCVLYIYKKKEFQSRSAQRWWLYQSLKSFKDKLDQFNITLEVIESESYKEVFEKILKKENFSIYWNKIYEPQFLLFDKKISNYLKLKNINFKIFKGNLLNEADEIKKSDNTPFKVFTAFWRTAEKFYLDKGFQRSEKIKLKNKKIKFLNQTIKLETVLPEKQWHKKFKNLWKPSEDEAIKNIKKFIKNELVDYGENRDIPGIHGTSKISPYLAFGQVHVETIWEECQAVQNKSKGYRKYINELGWREFSHSLINYFPEMLKGNLRKDFDKFPWQVNAKHLKAWKGGMTGYPIVDAGMRELYETGWMHNRVRMITASFLVKHLRIHWQEGEKYFRNCLLDFNEANNIAGWQWVAGCGADAAPYFRIFNPILQGEKFDPNGEYVKKWVPELLNVPKDFIHKPWELDKDIEGFEIGKNYPKPIVNHVVARNAALEAFKKIKKISI